eukprot:6980883-Pyramimonas_sp.AAC.1
MTNQNNLYLEELKSNEEARSSLQRVTSSNAKCPPAKPTGSNLHQLSTAQLSGIVFVPAQFDQTTLANAGASTLLVGGATHPPPEQKGNALPVDQSCAVCFRLKTDNCVGCGRSACEEHIDASTGKCSRCDLWKSESSAANVREEEI